MSTSNLKPSKEQLELNLDQYRMSAGANLSELEFEVLQKVCKTFDRAMRLVTRTALTQVSADLKTNLFPALTAGHAPLPMATLADDKDREMDNDSGGDVRVYRISIPISFVSKLLKAGPTRGGLPPNSEGDFFVSSTLVAVLAAYGHELNHVISGHLENDSSIGQETHADFIGGGLLWAWLADAGIAALCQVQSEMRPLMCVYGFLHLISILKDSDHDVGIYLPRCVRLAVFAGGAGFSADSSEGRAVGDLVERALGAMPTCPDADFDSSTIRGQFGTLYAQLAQTDMLAKMQQAFEMVDAEKESWYVSAEHLRQIKKDLRKAHKRDPLER